MVRSRRRKPACTVALAMQQPLLLFVLASSLALVAMFDNVALEPAVLLSLGENKKVEHGNYDTKPLDKQQTTR